VDLFDGGRLRPGYVREGGQRVQISLYRKVCGRVSNEMN